MSRESGRDDHRFGRVGRRLAVVAMIVASLSVGAGCEEDFSTKTVADAIEGPPDSSATTISLSGLSAPVTARYDEAGVLHLDCETAQDCYAAQGYFHARDRFFQMDLSRHQARGRLGEMFGVQFTLDRSDKFFRKLMTTREGRPLERKTWQRLDEPTKRMFRSYSRGINAWLDDYRAGETKWGLPEEFEFKLLSGYEKNIPDWKPIDTVAVYVWMTLQFGMFADWDVRRGKAVAALPADLTEDTITLRRPGIASSIIPSSVPNQPTSGSLGGGPPDEPSLPRSLVQRLEPHQELFGRAARKPELDSLLFGPTGSSASNSWVVGPSRTRDDVSFFAADPHLAMTNPSIWYFLEFDVEGQGESSGLHAAGASVPATPGVVVGHNEHIAWGPTIAVYDLADAYREQLSADGEHVIRNGKKLEIIERTYTFPGRNDSAKKVELEWVPGHGPIMEKDVDARSAISYKWVGQDPGRGPNFLAKLLRAESVGEAVDALDSIRALNLNWVIADDKGNIGWVPASDVPDRSEWVSQSRPSSLPIPGDGTAEWDGYLPDSKIPELRNPSSGFIATANNDFDGSFDDGNPYNDRASPLQSIVQYGHRHAAIVEGLAARKDHHLESMRRLQAKTTSLHARKILPEILKAVSGAKGRLSSLGNSVRAALQSWNYACPTGLEGSNPSEAKSTSNQKEARQSVGCMVFHAMLAHLTFAIFEDEFSSYSVYSVRKNWSWTNNKYGLQDTMIYLWTDPSVLTRGTAYFDDQSTPNKTESAEDMVVRAFDKTGSWLRSKFGSSSKGDWKWGREHVAVFASLLAAFGTDRYNAGPYANDGGYLTLDTGPPIRTNELTFEHRRSGSFRMIVRLEKGGGIDGWFQLPGGNVHHRDSQFYGNLIPDWLNNEPTPLRFDSKEVREAAARRVRLVGSDERMSPGAER